MIDIQQQLQDSVTEAKIELARRKASEDLDISIKRNQITMNAGWKVDEIISTIPRNVKEHLLDTKQINNNYGIKICELDFNDLTNCECGHGDPKPGSFAELLYNKLIDLGFNPQCRYDRYNWPNLKILRKWKYWAWMVIDQKQFYENINVRFDEGWPT